MNVVLQGAEVEMEVTTDTPDSSPDDVLDPRRDAEPESLLNNTPPTVIAIIEPPVQETGQEKGTLQHTNTGGASSIR
jgi:hypothetical protein